MNFLIFGIFLIEFCSAWRCQREKDRIKELYQQKRELQIERDQLAAEKGRFYDEYIGEIDELNLALEVKKEEIQSLKSENERLRKMLEDASPSCSTDPPPTETVTSTGRLFANFLVIPEFFDSSYLIKKDGSTSPATIRAPTYDFTKWVKHALVNGQLYIFGGYSDKKKIARLDGCRFNELSVRLNADRNSVYSEALSINYGSLALICFGYDDNSCETFDGKTAVTTFSTIWSHTDGGLGIYQNQATTVGCYSKGHKKVETLSSTGWSSLPDVPLRIAMHSLVGLENESMLLFGGSDSQNSQTGIWRLKEDEWSRIGELAKSALMGSSIYSGRSIYYFGYSSIQRIDFNEKEELENVEFIGEQRENSQYPVLFEASPDYCV